MKDLMLRDNRVIDMVFSENERQLNKWGVQEKTGFEWLTHTTEELGELAEAITEYEYGDGLQSKVVNEAIQTATLCLKIAEMCLNAVKMEGIR